MSEDIRPFLPLVATPTRSLGAALPALETPEVMSPWSPRPIATAAAPVVPAIDLAAIRDEARERGYADGLAQTAELRRRLVELVDEITRARAESVGPAGELIAELAACVVEAWAEGSDRGALFAPIVRAWLEQSPAQPASVRVHPGDAAVLTAVIGDAPLTVVAAPELAPGALEIRSATLELSHSWRARIADLRAAIVAALAGARP